MPADLFFSPPVTRNLSSRAQGDKIGPSGWDRSSKIPATDRSPQGEDIRFLRTLQQVSHDQIANRRSQTAGLANPAKCPETVVVGDLDDNAAPEGISDGMPAPNERDAQADQTAFDLNLLTFFKAFEDIGLQHAMEGSVMQAMSDFNSADGNPGAAINSLMARLQQIDLGSAADLKTGFERLQQIIAQALAGQAPAAIDGNALQAPGAKLMTEQAQIYQWLKGLLPGLQDQPFNSGWSAGEGAPGIKGSGTMPTDDKFVLETTVKPSEANQSVGGNGIFQSAENATARVPLENRHEAEPAKSAPATRSLGSENQPNPPTTQAVESAVVGASKIKETVGLLRDPQITSRTEGPDRTALPADPVRQTDSENPRHSQPLKSSAVSGINPALVKASESQIQSTSGAEPLSKVIQEIQLAKEGVVKTDSGPAVETISKVIKTEAATPDNNLFNASGHHMEKAAENASAPPESESSQSRLRNPTLDQIVHRAAILLRNGQHEARIDLKPDFLGHIRMHVISENQQVTVKILAEHAFVKDMIESNVHQLKADLQQHGLAVDKLEVTVSRDPEDPGHSREKLAQSKNRQGHAGHPNEDRPTGGQQTDSKRWRPTAPGMGSVDYFA